MTATIIPFVAKPVDPTIDGLTKAEASELIESSPFLKALEQHVAGLYGVEPGEVRKQLLRNNRDDAYDPKKPLEIDEAAVRAMVDEDTGRI